MPVFTFTNANAAGFTPEAGGFSIPVKVDGACNDGHPMTCTATAAEFRAGNMMVFCPACDAWVMPVWEFNRRNQTVDPDREIIESADTYSRVEDYLFSTSDETQLAADQFTPDN